MQANFRWHIFSDDFDLLLSGICQIKLGWIDRGSNVVERALFISSHLRIALGEILELLLLVDREVDA